MPPAADYFTDTIKMIAFRAEMALVRRPTLHWVPTEDDGRALVREMQLGSASIVPQGEKQRLLVRVHSLAGPRHNKALARLCESLISLEIRYLGTDLTPVSDVPPDCIEYLAYPRSPEPVCTAE